LVIAVLAAADPVRAQPSVVVENAGFQAPECVRHDPRADVYLVSNVHGGPAARDGNGFISRVAPDGRVISLKWIEGGRDGVELHAPKGMAIRGDTLFVADIDVVRAFHRRTGRPIGSRFVPGATFLNDLAVGRDGTLYVTDTGFASEAGALAPSGTDALYRFDTSGRPVVVARGPALGNPNGVAVDGSGHVVVVSVGSGEVYRVAPDGRRADLPKPPHGALDGVVALEDGSLLVSSWEAEAVYRFSGGSWSVAARGTPSPAAIGYDARRRRLLIPQMQLNRLEFRELADSAR
jgi:outer membrane protein assembly factor BamB